MFSELLHMLFQIIFYFLLPLAMFVVNFKLKRRHLEQCVASIPGPAPLPIIGNALLFAKLKSAKDLWDLFDSLVNKYGKLLKISLGQKLIVIISDPNYVEEILSSQSAILKDPLIYKALLVLSPGIISLNGKEWQNLRRPLNKLFRAQLMENNMQIFNENATILCEKLENYLEKGAINIHSFLKLCTMTIILRTHMGIDEIQEHEENIFDLADLLNRGIEITFQRAVKLQYYLNIIFNFTKNGRELKKIIAARNMVCTTVLKKRLEILNSRQDVNIDENPECYTDVIYSSGKRAGKTFLEMAIQLADFICAGFETTATTMAQTILYLAMYPQYQEKVYEELKTIFGSSNRKPTLKDINSMPYLNMVIKETQRCTGIPGIFRILSKDINLDKYTIPKGATVYLQFSKMHQDMRYWEHPKKFYPEHFLPEAVAKRPKGAYMPFSNGPRGCPGAHFGEISMLTILSTLFRTFLFTTSLTPDKLEFKYGILLESIQGYKVEIHKRSN